MIPLTPSLFRRVLSYFADCHIRNINISRDDFIYFMQDAMVGYAFFGDYPVIEASLTDDSVIHSGPIIAYEIPNDPVEMPDVWGSTYTFSSRAYHDDFVCFVVHALFRDDLFGHLTSKEAFIQAGFIDEHMQVPSVLRPGLDSVSIQALRQLLVTHFREELCRSQRSFELVHRDQFCIWPKGRVYML